MNNRTLGRDRCSLGQNGQATTEVLAALLVFVPLLALVPLLGKVADVNHTAIEASRYSAWERTVAGSDTKSDADVQMEVQRRFFNNPDVFIVTGEVASTEGNQQNPIWNTTSMGRVVKSVDEHIRLSLQNDETPGAMAGTMATIMTELGGLISALDDDAEFDLTTDGLMTARVGVNIDPDVSASDQKGCDYASSAASYACIMRHNVILAGTWDASEPEDVERRVKAFVPAEVLSFVQDIRDILTNVPLLGDAIDKMTQEWEGFEPGHVEPDEIPADRLSD